MTRQVDLINVFNSAGLSCYSEAHYERRIAELEAEVRRLQGLYEAAKRRLAGESVST